MKQHQNVSAGGHGPSAPFTDVRESIGGLLPGTVVLTSSGEQKVETLRAGDRIITRDAGLVLLFGVSASRLHVRTVRILAGSLGHMRPEEDLELPAEQKILLRDWRARALFGQPRVLARAGALVDDEFITDLGLASRQVWHLSFDRPHIIFAGGVELEVSGAGAAELHDAA